MINKMTVTEFFAKGYKLVNGDIYYSTVTNANYAVGADVAAITANIPQASDTTLYVISAKALEESRTKADDDWHKELIGMCRAIANAYDGK